MTLPARLLLTVTLALGLTAGSALARPPFASAKASLERYTYPAADTLNFALILPPYPEAGTPAAAEDEAALRSLLAAPGTPAFEAAGMLARSLSPDRLLTYFTQDVARRYRVAHAPATLRLLSRLRATLDPITGAAKKAFARPRPFRVLGLPETCDSSYSPAAGETVGMRDSYPSGHATFSWAAGLVLAQIAPEHAPEFLQLAAAFGQARNACGVHWPSDVKAGQLLATAVINRLAGDALFEADLAEARAEYLSLTED